MTLRILQFIWKNAVKAGLPGHRFKVDPQHVRHAPIAEDGTALRVDDPDAFRHRLDNPPVHLIADAHVPIGWHRIQDMTAESGGRNHGTRAVMLYLWAASTSF